MKKAVVRKKKIEIVAQKLGGVLKVSELVERCGPPTRTRGHAPWPVRMDYLGSDGHSVELTFECGRGTREDNCIFLWMDRIREPYESHVAEEYETGEMPDGTTRWGDPIRQVEELPCLAGVETQPLR